MATCGIQVIWHEEDAGEASVGASAVILSDDRGRIVAYERHHFDALLAAYCEYRMNEAWK